MRTSTQRSLAIDCCKSLNFWFMHHGMFFQSMKVWRKILPKHLPSIYHSLHSPWTGDISVRVLSLCFCHFLSWSTSDCSSWRGRCVGGIGRGIPNVRVHSFSDSTVVFASGKTLTVKESGDICGHILEPVKC